MASNREARIKIATKVFEKHTEKYNKFGRQSKINGIFTCLQCPVKSYCLGNRQYRISKRHAFELAEDCNYIKYLLTKMNAEELNM